MELTDAVEDVLLGAALKTVAADYRKQLIEHFGLDEDDIPDATFAKETAGFMRTLCRQLGEKHEGDNRVEMALREWILRTEDYEAWDALLAHFEFDGKEALVRRGRVLFPGPLTAHWDQQW